MRVSKHLLWILLLACQPCLAESLEQGPVRLVETDDSVCLAHGGKLVSVQLTDADTILQ